MATIATDNSKAWYGEPAVIKAAIAAVLVGVVGILNGTTDLNDGIAGVITTLIPIITGFWIRRSVTPVPASQESDV